MSDAPEPATASAFEALCQDVARQPWAHDFFALLRQVDVLHPGAPRTGEALRPRQESLRLGQPPMMDFAPEPLRALAWRDGRPHLGVRFFGLTGPNGALPLHLSDHLHERAHTWGDPAPAHFLDLFHHRALALFWRAWAQAQPVVQADRPDDDGYLRWLSAAAGLPASGVAPLTPQALASQAGFVGSGHHHPEALAKVLHQRFGVTTTVAPHQTQWLALPTSQRSRLGVARNRRMQPAAALGRSANAGSRVWDRQHRFGLQLGPLTLSQYLAFIPGGAAWPELVQWVGLLAGGHNRWHLTLQLAAPERPRCGLGRRVQLGVSSWLGQPRASAQPLQIRPGTSFLQRRAAAHSSGASHA